MKAMSNNIERVIKTYNVQSHIGQSETDCISCNKHIHRIPNKKICKLLCGIPKQSGYVTQKVPKKYKLKPEDIILINRTANFMELLTTPK